MTITIRNATENDLDRIVQIVNHYAEKNLMLWRTQEQIAQVLSRFLVAEDDGRVVGCGSLVELTPQLVEVRSLAVAPEYQGRGLGTQIVAALVEEARKAGYPQACALTLREGFFNAAGFATVDRWALAPKVWHECIYCAKFHACDEIAVLMDLKQPAEVPAGRFQLFDFPKMLLRRGRAWLTSMAR